jgi:hypothetical protein
MSKLHVTQIGGYLQNKLAGVINMDDYAHHADKGQVQKAFLTRALAALAIAQSAEVNLEELGPNIVDGTNDGGMDGIYFDPNEQTLYLVQSKWHEDGHGSIELGEALKFLEGVGKVLNNELGALNPRVQARQGDVQSALFDASAKFVLVVAYTGQEALAPPVADALNKFVNSQNDVSEIMKLSVLTQGELHRAVSAGVAGVPISLEIQLTSWGQIREPHVGFYGQVCATDVAQWMKAHGNRLFSSNLRQFLGGSTVNDDLVATLKTRPEDFWYLNNGITAVVSEVAKKPLGGNSTDSGTFECKGFSVVNGAQTVGSIHAASVAAPNEVAKAMVSLRVISTAKSSATFGTDVTRCTNTQNAIAKRDFVALDPEQERLRQELHFDGIEYAYKAGAVTGPGPGRFDLNEATLALVCASSQVDLAVQAKREISKLWEDITKVPYKALFHAGVSGPHVWEQVQALRAIDAALQTVTRKHSGRDALICIHGNRFIQWAAMQGLGLKPGAKFAPHAATVQAIVDGVVPKVIAAVKAKYPDSYPASLFKNLTKCRALAAAV